MSARSFSQTQFEKAVEYEKVTFFGWVKLRKYFLISMALILGQDIIGRIRSEEQTGLEKIIMPSFLFLILISMLILQVVVTKIDDMKNRLIMEVINDIYQIMALTLFVAVDHANNLKQEHAFNFYEEAFKVMTLVFLGLSTLYFWISKMAMIFVILIVDLFVVIEWNKDLTFGMLSQGIVRVFCFTFLVFIYESMKKNASKSYVKGKTLETSLKRFIDFIDQGIVAVDKNGKCVYWNKSLSNLLEANKLPAEANQGLDLTLIKNIRWKKDFGKILLRHKTAGITKGNTMDTLFLDESATTATTAEKPSTLAAIILLLTSKWVQTVDYFEEIGYEGKNCVVLEGEKDGLLLEIKISLTMFQENPSLLFLISNVTEKNSLDHLKENNKFKDSYLLSISHELMNPLNGSLVYLQGAIEDSTLPKNIKQEFLLPSKNSLNFLQYLISDLLDFTNLNANALKLRFYEQSLIGSIEEALNLIQPQAKKKGIEIIKIFEIPSRMQCTTDHKRLLQILVNLLQNGLTYTFKGSITLKVTKKSYKEYIISVEDTGIGMREDEKVKIIDPLGKIIKSFSSLNSSLDLGFGLLISNELAKRLGPVARPIDCGLTCISEFQQGSIFSFILEDKSFSESIGRTGSHYQIHIVPDIGPQNRSYDIDFEESHESHQNNAYDLLPRFIPETLSSHMLNSSESRIICQCPEVLLVDSEMFSISSLERIFRGLNFSTFSAFNGMEALQQVKDRNENKCSGTCKFLKLIFVAGNMPVLNGSDLSVFYRK